MILPRPKHVFSMLAHDSNSTMQQRCKWQQSINPPTFPLFRAQNWSGPSSGAFGHASLFYCSPLCTKPILATPDESARYIHSIEELTSYNGTALLRCTNCLSQWRTRDHFYSFDWQDRPPDGYQFTSQVNNKRERPWATVKTPWLADELETAEISMRLRRLQCFLLCLPFVRMIYEAILQRRHKKLQVQIARKVKALEKRRMDQKRLDLLWDGLVYGGSWICLLWLTSKASIGIEGATRCHLSIMHEASLHLPGLIAAYAPQLMHHLQYQFARPHTWMPTSITHHSFLSFHRYALIDCSSKPKFMWVYQ